MRDIPLHHFILPTDRPIAFQLSGGRTSAMMLRYVLSANPILPPQTFFMFENTGREMPETLDFVHALGQNWGVKIHWLEYTDEKPFFQIVGHNSAARNGEPFEALIRKRKYVPNRVTRYCTEVLKVRTAKRFLISQGCTRWTSVIGFRADEMVRVNKMRESRRERERPFMPLADAGVSKFDVMQFWKEQSFDLKLPNIKGKTPLGNCDGCFMKSEKTRAFLARYQPDRAEWWDRMEKETGTTFTHEKPWGDLIDHAKNQADWVFDDKSEVYCTTSLGGCHEY